ncbi:MAG: PAS domain S-box protein [Gemmatimonadaceae bacterium]
MSDPRSAKPERAPPPERSPAPAADISLASAPIGFGVLDRELRYIHVNDYLAAVNGVPAEAHVGRCAWEVAPEATVAVAPMLRRVLETGESIVGVEVSGAQLGMPNDPRIWETGVFPVRANTTRDAKIAGVGLLITDVTARRRALRESEDRFRLLVESVKDYAIFMLDPAGNVATWNEGARSIKGYEAGEILGHHFSAFYPPEDTRRAAQALEAAARDGRFEDEGWRVRKDGSRFWANVVVTALFGADRQLIGFAKVTRDLTERAQAEEALERHSLVFETIGDGVLVMDLEGQIRDMNPGAEKLFGYTKAELLGRPVVALHHPSLEGRREATIQAGLRRDGRWAGELPFRRKDGSEGVADVVVVAHQNEHGVPNAWIGVNRDITARRQAEHRLEESRALLAAAEELASVGSWAIAVGSTTLTWSDELYRIMGLEPQSEAVTTESFVARVHEDDRARVRSAFQQLLENGVAPPLECRIVRPDGSERILQAKGRVQRDSSDRVVRIVGSAQDITERLATEHELRRTHETLRALVNAAPVAIAALDLEERITLWNAAAERLFGWTAAEVLGKPVPFAEKRDASDYARLKDQVLTGKSVTGVETRRQRKDGTSVDVLLSCAPSYDRAAKVFGAVALYLDLTEHRRLEEQLRQSQKMEAVGQLAGGVAHDFNNLLTVIKAYSGLVADELEERSPLKRDVVEIQRAAGRAASLTQQLLAFSRKQILQPRVLDLNYVARELEPMLRRLIDEDVQVVLRLTNELGRVKADVSQIEQVLINLIVNARDAMPSGGAVTIHTANVELDEEYHGAHPVITPGPYVMLAVSDTGVGMDDATRARIFEPFFTTKPPGKGTGLGLSTVYGTVKQSNGFIWAYSEPGVGSTFKIYLPRLEAEEISAASSAEEPVLPLIGTETVLLVEDDPAVRSLARRVLERNGYTVLESPDGRDALRVSDQYRQPIQLLVTDMMLPEMTGPEVWKTLSMNRPELRVLFMSGYTNEDMIRRGMLDSRTAFLEKPFTAADLARRARSILDANR